MKERKTLEKILKNRFDKNAVREEVKLIVSDENSAVTFWRTNASLVWVAYIISWMPLIDFWYKLPSEKTFYF